MAVDNGPIDFSSGTGTDTFTTPFTPTWAMIYFQGSGIKDMKGFATSSSHNTVYPAPGEALNTSKAIIVKNTSGTIVFEGNISFNTNQILINKTTNTLGTPRANIFYGNN